MSAIARNIAKIVFAREQAEGAGARVRRSIGGRELRNLDPFLMLDEFNIQPPAGFPDHPHRGFETITYMITGKVCHEDFKGHRGEIGPGDLQWMSAGRGIVHSEMPGTREPSLGLQLWVNLASAHKMDEPNYQELRDSDMPHVKPETGVDIKIIAGESYGVKSKVITKTPTMYIDVTMEKGKKIEQTIPKEYQGFIYVFEGSALFGGDKKKGDAHNALVLSSNNGETIPVETTDSKARFFIIAGKPLKERAVQYGPFVMNTEEEIFQAMLDYEHGTNGFEGAQKWRSEISTMWH